MLIVLVAVLIVLILGAAGFALHILWWIAVAALIIWLLGYLLSVGNGAKRPRRRWYYW
jgi:hypothetical protein